MKKSIAILLFLFPIMVIAHPIKMSLIYIEYKPESKTVYVECRMFADDLSLAISQEVSKKVSVGYWDDRERDIVNEFIKKHVKVKLGNKTLNLDFSEQDFDRSQNVVTLKYEFSSITLKAGEKVTMSNNLFFKQFKFAQTNVFQLEIPRVAQTTLQCYMDDYSKTFTVKK